MKIWSPGGSENFAAIFWGGGSTVMKCDKGGGSKNQVKKVQRHLWTAPYVISNTHLHTIWHTTDPYKATPSTNVHLMY